MARSADFAVVEAEEDEDVTSALGATVTLGPDQAVGAALDLGPGFPGGSLGTSTPATTMTTTRR
ncbi:MAG: hypothetical protein R3F60_24475 [bacterium]